MPDAARHDPWPQYCCAILRDADGRYLLEQRPPDGRAAAGLLTCFGGTRQPGEHPDACIRRELLEELGVDYSAIELALRVRLIGDTGNTIAWFYAGPAPTPDRIVPEPGVSLVWTLTPDCAGIALSAWHRAALAADRDGRPAGRVDHGIAG